MTAKKPISIRNMVLISMFTAALAVASQFSVPMPSGVPLTFQVLVVALCGMVLGWRIGAAAMIIYILIGAIGVPVFANFGAGPATLFGRTGGFILGYPFLASFCGFARSYKSHWLRLIFAILGLLLCHVCGILQYMLLTGTSFMASALLISIPYLLKDILLVTTSTVLEKKFKKLLPNE